MSDRVVEKREKVKWTTWEELLLTYAVKRHGIKDWDSIAMELQNRSSNIPLSLTAQACKTKYRDLKRRFIGNRDDDDGIETGNDNDEVDSTIPWLEELRKLRVSELKQEVQRYDLSIQSLQLKVKRLEREREQGSKENENREEKPDLEMDSKEDRSEEDKTDGVGVTERTLPEQIAGKSVSGQNSDRENRSFNESNSTGDKGDNRETGGEDGGRVPATAEDGVGKPDRASSESKPVGEDSCNDSSDTVARHAASKPSQKKKVGNSAELRDSGTESKEGTKESSEVQSSASLTRKKRRHREAAGGGSGGGGEPVVSPATTTTTTNTKGETMKSEPLAGVLDIIRSHKYGSVFERRLEIQKTDKYKKIVRQHMDLETVQTRFNDGSYSSCPTKLHRDLLLLFNNAIVFFPKTSSESIAASKLRDLLLKETKKIRTQRSYILPNPAPSHHPQVQPKPDPERSDSLLLKQKSSAPIVVCRKRSSISAKPSNPIKAEKQNPDLDLKPSAKSSSSVKEEQSHTTKMKMREKPVTGTRSLRRGSRSQTNSKPNDQNNQNTNTGSADHKSENSKKKSSDVLAKKRGAADFLKRIKKQSPGKGTLLERLKSSGNEGGNGRGDQKKRENGKKEVMVRRSSVGGKQGKEESPSKRSVGRPPKRGREVVPAKRGREGGEGEGSSKRPNKRSRK